MRLQVLDGYRDMIPMLKVIEDYERILCIRHNGDKKDPNPHWHFVFKTQVKDKAFRKRMVAIFDKGKGNGHMSIKQWDGCEDALSYMFHEETVAINPTSIVLNKGYDDADITRFLNMNFKRQELIKEAKGKASYLLEAIVLADTSITKRSCSLDIAKCIVLTAMRQDKYCPNDFMLKSMTDKIRFKVQNGDVHGEECIAEEIARRALRL